MCTPRPYVAALYPDGKDIWLLDTDLRGRECEVCRQGVALAKYLFWSAAEAEGATTAWAHFECARRLHPFYATAQQQQQRQTQ